MNRRFRPRRGVYTLLAVLLLLLGATAGVSAEIQISVNPAMTKGPATAPVTIVEFSDYQ